jgi:anti-anti-sigma factor
MAEADKKRTSKVITPGRDIVASMAEDFKGRLIDQVKTGLKELVIDLSGVEVIDSIGLGVVIATHNSLKNAGGKLKIINASEDIFRLFETMRLDQHFNVQRA